MIDVGEDTHQKALRINLDPRWYGTVAEIGPQRSADAAVGEINPEVKPPVAEGQQPNMVSRWLGRSDADPSNNPIFLTSPTPLAGPLPNGSVPVSPVANKDDPDTNASAAQ